MLLDHTGAEPLPFGILDAKGETIMNVPVPNTPALIGTRVRQQAFVADPAGPLGLSATRGLDVRIVDFGLLVAVRDEGNPSTQVAIDLNTGTRSTAGTWTVSDRASI